MKYSYIVNYKGRYYGAGQDVPVPQSEEAPKYKKTDIMRMSVAELKTLALTLSIEDAEGLTGETLKESIIAKLGL